jgi:hypothetical protein
MCQDQVTPAGKNYMPIPIVACRDGICGGRLYLGRFMGRTPFDMELTEKTADGRMKIDPNHGELRAAN